MGTRPGRTLECEGALEQGHGCGERGEAKHLKVIEETGLGE